MDASVKIAVVGAGAVGSFYGARLQRAGHNVEFYTESGASMLFRNRMHIKSVWGDFSLKVKAFEKTTDMQPADLVIISMKVLPDIPYNTLLAPLVSSNTVILALQNGINMDEKLMGLFPHNTILGGLAFTCINRLRPNQIVHVDYGKIIIGHQDKKDSEVARYVRDIFDSAGIEVEVEANLRRLRWKKLLWNVPFNCLSVIGGSVSTDQLVNDSDIEGLILELMEELRKIAQADGVRIPRKYFEEMLENTRKMVSYKTSMLIDYEKGRAMEVEAIAGEPLKMAEKYKIDAPILSTIYRLLSFYDRHRNF